MPKVDLTCYYRGPNFDLMTYKHIQSVFRFSGGAVRRAIFLDFARIDVWFFRPKVGLTCYYRGPNFDLVTYEPINQSLVNDSDIFIFRWNVHFMSICSFTKWNISTLSIIMSNYRHHAQKVSAAECFSYCRNPGLNQGPLDLQSNALPTELFRLTKKHACSFWVETIPSEISLFHGAFL